MAGLGEFELIDRIRHRAATRADVRLGIGDDAAVLAPRSGHELVVTTDSLVEGVHFAVADAAADVGWKALAVNLSDLAAMGAQAAWATLALTLPEPDSDWLDAFLDGFLELATKHQVALVGGDLTRGPRTIGVTAIGWVPEGRALQRGGARSGDAVCVTGTLGDAGGALALREHGRAGDAVLSGRLHRPTPRLAAGVALRGFASACIDLSDGLLADLGHIGQASGVGAEVELARLPASAALAQAFDEADRWPLQLAAGDDYELCFALAPSHLEQARAALLAEGIAMHCIGRIVAGSGVCVIAPDGSDYRPPRSGYAHFGGDGA
ncbi:MAG TPA: thiamine-phosphate kinase [Xanthomonadaceae bacterium]|nr:thiamine-phosphate kinase [Xanthomonadaceae bacterium]